MECCSRSYKPAVTSAHCFDDEFVLSDIDFARISKKIHKMTGIVVPPHKRQMIFSRLVRRLRVTKVKSFAEYLNYIETASGIVEIESFINAITTNITGFFREKHHFDHLEQAISKDIHKSTKPVMIWSAGCSSGEEPYSIAMTIHEKLIERGRSYRILATDLDTSVLEKARSGRYEMSTDGKVFNIGEKYTSKKGKTVEISKQLRESVYFKRLNLFETLPFDCKFDYIFCRNVLIYFDIKRKVQVINKLESRLRTGGFLYLGHSESLFEEVPKLRSRGKTIYEKIR